MNSDNEPITAAPGPTPAAGIAEAVGAALTQAAAAASPRSRQDAAEIQAITDAMIRLLVGIPLRSDGQLTIKSLAEEARLRRNKLTHKHTGLKDLFYALLHAQHGRPKLADELTKQNDQLRAKLSKVSAERDTLQAQVKHLARVIHVLEVENHQIREAATDPRGVVRVMPERRRPSDTTTQHP
jgi:hypothetical protein